VKVAKHGPRLIFRGQRRWLSALAAGTFAATLLLWTDSATAGCGDYVIFRPLDRVVSPAEVFLPAHSGHVLPAMPPCHGPLCRRSQPVEPVPTPPTPEQIDQRPLALIAVGMEVESPFLAGGGWPRLDESPLDGFGQSLLRPPCA
jgi:hypothetical protein